MNPALGLNGYCDYLLSTDTDSFDISSAVFCLVEAKNRSVEEGLGQAGADRAENKPNQTVFGCVTNAYDGPTFRWLFLKLENNLLTLDTDRYYLSDNELPRLLVALAFIVKSATA